MEYNKGIRKMAYIYLCMVPLIAFVLAFAVGHVTPRVYVPVWIVHSVVMVLLAWHLGLRYALTDVRRSRIALLAMLLLVPWILAAVFAGMGPPPFDMKGWAELAAEQRFRFGILVVCGVSLASAFSLIYTLAKEPGETIYSRLSLTGILIALPLFIVVMAFWGTVFTDTAVIVSKATTNERPVWLAPWRHMTDFLTTAWVCLFYLSTALLALSMKKLNWLSAKASNVYFGLSLFAVAATLLPDSVPEPLVILNYVTGIPAITMVMPYLMGLVLLRRIEFLK